MKIELDADGTDLTITQFGGELIASIICSQDDGTVRHVLSLTGKEADETVSAANSLGVDLTLDGTEIHLSRTNGVTDMTVSQTIPFKGTIRQKQAFDDVTSLKAALENAVMAPARDDIAIKVSDAGSDIKIEKP